MKEWACDSLQPAASGARSGERPGGGLWGVISERRGLQRLLSPVVLLLAASALLIAGYGGDLARRVRHSYVAYQALRASQPTAGSDLAPLSWASGGQHTWEARTLWLMGRHSMYAGRPVQAVEALAEAGRLLPADYQVHRDLLYAYDGSGQFRQFAREYERGASAREAVQSAVTTGGGPPAYAEALAGGGFDVVSPRSRERVLAGYVRLAGENLEDADLGEAAEALQFSVGQFGDEPLVLSQVLRACQLGWGSALCSEVSADDLTISRVRGWDSASLTDLVSDLALSLYDQGQWSDLDLLALGRYLA